MPLAFVATIVLPFLGSTFSVIAPLMSFSLGFLINFAVTRIPRIPKYIEILLAIYQDSSPESPTRKVLTAMLLGMGGIATFMAHSFIPFTTVPLIGAITGPIAILFATCVIFLTLDLVLSFNTDLQSE